MRPADPGSGPWAVEHPQPEAATAMVLALDTINFGSGWHPVVRKRPGCSGAVTMATNLREHVARHGDVTAAWLAALEPADAHRIFDQPHDDGPVHQLMVHFATALAELGVLVETDFDGSFVALVESADGAAAGLVDVLASLPGFADVWTHDGLEVPILKRAQLAVADLHRTFGGDGPGRFHDVDRLTAFADNLVPHVLRLDGVLELDGALVARIEAEELLEPGSREEVEIRAVGLHAVEELRRALAAQGHDVASWHLDQVLWSRGGAPRYKAHPRHRARSTAY
nr:queuosine salvage family protein [Rhabdothermincola salaria]